MPFYDFTREPAREFSLKELVSRISELERRRQADQDAAESESENPSRRRRTDREAQHDGEAERLTE